MSPLGLRPAVHHAAIATMMSDGYRGTTPEAIAQRAGVDAQVVRDLAPDLDQLLAEALVTGFEAWRSAREDWLPLPTGASMPAHLSATLLGQVRRLTHPPEVVVVGVRLLLEDVAEDLPARSVVLDYREQAESEATAWLRYAVDRDPAMPPCRPEVARDCARIMVAVLEGYLVSSQIDDDLDPDGFASVVLGVILRALSGDDL